VDRPIKDHIAHLEQKIEQLKAKLADPHRTDAEKVVARIDLGIAERAITHYRKALELEGQISD